MQRRKAQAQEVGGYNAAKDQKQIWTSSWWINHPGSVHTKLINAIQQLLVKNDKQGEEGGGGGGGLITEGELNRGFTVFSNTPYEKSAYQYKRTEFL